MIVTLGISAFFHDSAAALLIDGELICAAQEERFNREKNTSIFPSEAIKVCLKETKLEVSDIDEVVFFEKPLLKFERILENFYQNVPKGWRAFLQAIPDWSQRKLFIKREVKNEMKAIGKSKKLNFQLYFSSHHLSHAASAYYPSPFDEAAILCIDAVGEWSTATISVGKGNQIEILKEMKFPDSLGLLYSSFTYYLGFKVNEGEYKMMGLSPFGNIEAQQTQYFLSIIKNQLVSIYKDGSFKINQEYFNYAHGLKMVNDKKWKDLFGFTKRLPQEKLDQTHANFSLAIQIVTEEIILKMALNAQKLTGLKNVCLAGGVALNCVANGKLQESNIFDSVWVQPASGDAGGALGAALALYYVKHRKEKCKVDAMKNGFLGNEISNKEIQDFCIKEDRPFRYYENNEELNSFLVHRMKKGEVIGYVQGKMEFGPRALGARSILALPSYPKMQSKLNLAVKFREDFRPFAPIMLEDEALKYFELEQPSSYMQFVRKLRPEYRLDLPANFGELTIEDKLKVPRSKFQAITHVDFSSRLQVVSDSNHSLYKLLLETRKETGDGILINTSFNRNGEPIVCNLNDIFTCFEETQMDILVINNYVFEKK